MAPDQRLNPGILFYQARMSKQLSTPNMSQCKYDGTPTYEGRKCGLEVVRLLRAPKAESDAMWKAQAFDFCIQTPAKQTKQ